MVSDVEKMAAKVADGPKKSIPNKKEVLHIIIYISALLTSPLKGEKFYSYIAAFSLVVT